MALIKHKVKECALWFIILVILLIIGYILEYSKLFSNLGSLPYSILLPYLAICGNIIWKTYKEKKMKEAIIKVFIMIAFILVISNYSL